MSWPAPTLGHQFERGREVEREDERYEESTAERQGECAKKRAGYAVHKDQRQEDHDNGGGRGDERPRQFRRRVTNRDLRTGPAGMRAMDRFDHHNRIVDEQPDAPG